MAKKKVVTKTKKTVSKKEPKPVETQSLKASLDQFLEMPNPEQDTGSHSMMTVSDGAEGWMFIAIKGPKGQMSKSAVAKMIAKDLTELLSQG